MPSIESGCWMQRNGWKVSVDFSFVHILDCWILLLAAFAAGNWCVGIGFFIGESAGVQSWCWRCHHSGRNKLGVGRRRKRRRKILVSNGIESVNMRVQGMAAEVWRSIYCMGKLAALAPFLSELCLGIRIVFSRSSRRDALSGCLFEAAAFLFWSCCWGCRFLISSEAETA